MRRWPKTTTTRRRRSSRTARETTPHDETRTGERDLRFIEKLAAGVTIEEIAASEGISVQWARERKAAILASRAIDPPHEFMQLQIRRLSEAMLVSYSAMSARRSEGGRPGDQSCARARPLSRVRPLLDSARVSPRWRRSRRRPSPCRSPRPRLLRRKPSRPMGLQSSLAAIPRQVITTLSLCEIGSARPPSSAKLNGVVSP